jgi:excisionase family DNA binding protein
VNLTRVETCRDRSRLYVEEGALAQHRYSTDEAARMLGISIDAVRKRAERGQLPYEREGGRLYILLDAVATKSRHYVEGESSALISAKDETIATLREQLEAEREANRENRRIIAALTSRIPELPPTSPQRPPEAPVSPAEPQSSTGEPGHAERPFTDEEPERGEARPWWRRMFGG